MSNVIYSKTGKGLSAINSGTPKLPQIAANVLAQIDGKSSITEIHAKCPKHSRVELEGTIDWLLRSGYAKSLISDIQTDHALDGISVVTLSMEKSVLEWAKAQRLTKSLANNGYCSSSDIKQLKPNNASILIVEDDPQLAQMEIALFKGEGYHVSLVDSGERALDKLQDEDMPDVVILDVELPGINGFETLRRIRAMKGTATLPVIMVTSRASDEDVMEGLTGGADGYIFKPFNPNKLTGYLLQALGW